MLSWLTGGESETSTNSFSFPTHPEVTILSEPQSSDVPIIIDGMVLFSYKEIMAIREEATNEQDYEVLYEEPENYRRMLIKKKGEGSTGEIKRHKYTRKRNVLRVFRYVDKESGHKVVISIERTAHKGVFPVQGRDFISMTGVVQLNEFHYVTLSKALEFRMVPYATTSSDKTKSPPPLPADKYGPSEGFNGYIRGVNKFFANECFGNETTTTYTTIVETDVRGWVPATVYNWFVKFIPAQGEGNLIKGLEWRKTNGVGSDLNEFYYNHDSPLFNK
ncbi:hypothetical protein C9374_010645 [Naegleria lovaniensis]|uniref:Uncharacterized protein n=1 Tax=Naegleria lovaniensis TaxID=51637 RepID=A0AA88GI88_NAELO|nr:uncharacterized protein C9374_010645 [Naegleria lovaniensis]KAG2374626.1 hypothetical protein C9374_010645 [Naegleria lovaniensis]